jgi:protein required for attachment to host cells
MADAHTSTFANSDAAKADLHSNSETNIDAKRNAASNTTSRKRSVSPTDQTAEERHALANSVSDNFLRLQCKMASADFLCLCAK